MDQPSRRGGGHLLQDHSCDRDHHKRGDVDRHPPAMQPPVPPVPCAVSGSHYGIPTERSCLPPSSSSLHSSQRASDSPPGGTRSPVPTRSPPTAPPPTPHRL